MLNPAQNEPILPGPEFAEWVASLGDEQRERVTPDERAQRQRELDRQAGWL